MPNPEALQYGTYYHIYNRGNNGENIFREKRNYQYFLDLYTKHVAPFVDTYAYVLLRNHFHFSVRIKEKEEILGDNQNLTGFRDLSGLSERLPSQKFANLFNAYAKSINKSYGRSGALFERPFGRKLITGEAHLFHLIKYIHFNPQKHGFVTDFREWQHSSYQSLILPLQTKLNRDEVLIIFGGLTAFEKEHTYEVIDKDFLLNFIGDDVD
jgi:putative transposase